MADLSRASRPYGDRLRVHHLGPLEQGNGPLRLALIEDFDQMTVAISVALIQRRVSTGSSNGALGSSATGNSGRPANRAITSFASCIQGRGRAHAPGDAEIDGRAPSLQSQRPLGDRFHYWVNWTC